MMSPALVRLDRATTHIDKSDITGQHRAHMPLTLITGGDG